VEACVEDGANARPRETERVRWAYLVPFACGGVFVVLIALAVRLSEC
jgi:hypothetical protein